MSKSDNQQLATRKDVEEIVGRVVGEIVGDALQLISERFDRVEAEHRAFKDATQASLNRIENKLDATIDRVDNHEIRLMRIERRTA